MLVISRVGTSAFTADQHGSGGQYSDSYCELDSVTLGSACGIPSGVVSGGQLSKQSVVERSVTRLA